MLSPMNFQTIGHYMVLIYFMCVCERVVHMRVCWYVELKVNFQGHDFDFGDRVPYWTWSLMTRLSWLAREPRDPPPSTSQVLELCPTSHIHGGIQLRSSCFRGKHFTDWAIVSSDGSDFFVQHQYNHLFLLSTSQRLLFYVVTLAWLGLPLLLWILFEGPLWSQPPGLVNSRSY